MVFGLVYRLVNAIVFLWVSLGTLGSYTIFVSPYDYMNALTLQTHIMYHKFGPNYVYPKPNFNLCEGPLNPDLNLVPN